MCRSQIFGYCPTTSSSAFADATSLVWHRAYLVAPILLSFVHPIDYDPPKRSLATFRMADFSRQTFFPIVPLSPSAPYVVAHPRCLRHVLAQIRFSHSYFPDLLPSCHVSTCNCHSCSQLHQGRLHPSQSIDHSITFVRRIVSLPVH
jgi:hypothetical protein